MAFWGGSRLADGIPSFDIVRPFDRNSIDCNAYTLTMGEEYYVTPEPGMSLRENKKHSLKKRDDISKPTQLIKGRNESFVIPSGQFAFLLTEESIKMPAHLMGFISLKSGVKFRGLINVSGFHVDPGFEGNLIYSVFNAGPQAIHIARGDQLFLLWIADVDGNIDTKYFKNEKFPQTEIPTKLVSEVAREIQSIQGLSDRISIAERKINQAWGLGLLVVGALTLFLGLIAALPEATFYNLVKFFRG